MPNQILSMKLSMKKSNLSSLSIKLFLTALLLALVSGCGEDIDLDRLTESSSERVTAVLDSNETNESSESSTSSETTVSNNTTTSSDDGANPLVRSTQFFGQNGNVYKPVSDETASGGGNMVVLFSAAFTRQFESCSVLMGDGSSRALTCIDDQPWTQIPFSCFSNGNRQTWRADFRCGSVGAVVVTCVDFNQEITFTVPEGQQGNVCTRFG